MSRYVVVTTRERGVFFGLAEDESKLPAEITLTAAQMCIRWSEQERGVLGLAAGGPGDNCRISPVVPEQRLWNITGVTQCTPQAIERWKASPWRQ